MPAAETIDLTDLTPDVAQNQELLDYWHHLRGDGPGAPARERFDPMAVPRLLPNIMLVERGDDDVLQVRLMGTVLADRMERDLTGLALLANLPEALRESAEAAYADVLNLPCVLLVRRRIERVSGAIPVAEVLHLPWCDATGRMRYVITAVWGVHGRIAPGREDAVRNWNVAAERLRAPL